MSKIKIEGGYKLTGEIEVSGAKNSAVALVPAAILCDEEVTISNVPNKRWSVNNRLIKYCQ